MSTQPSPNREPSAWALTGVVFAASILGLIGVFHIISGAVAIFDDDFYVKTANYTFNIDISAYGWIHLLLGCLILLICWGLVRASVWAAGATIAIALFSAVANFMSIPYYPLWSIVLVALNVWVIWAITRPGALDA